MKRPSSYPDPALAAALEAVVLLEEGDELAGIGWWKHAIAGGRSIWSRGFYRLLGLEPGTVEPGSEAFLERVHPEDRARIERERDVLETPDQFPDRVWGACRVIRGDGSVRELRYYGRLEVGGNPAPTWWIGVIRDVTGARGRGRAGKPGPRGLSGREAEVLRLAAAGHSGPEIARRLYISPGTVKTHFANIYEKLGVSDRTAAVARALRQGLIS